MTLSLTLSLLVAAVIGAAATWLWLRGSLSALRERLAAAERQAEDAAARLQSAETKAAAAQEESARLSNDLAGAKATLAAQQEAHANQVALLEKAEQRLKDSFNALANDALQGNTEQFLKLAQSRLSEQQKQGASEIVAAKTEVEQLVNPISEALKRFQEQVQQLETQREGAYQGMHQQIELLLTTQKDLKTETSKLVTALRAPVQRGRWGEVQLKRVVELCGMLEHCDFVQQQSYDTDDGRLRPDMIVRLPGGRHIVVDAKVSLNAFLDAAAIEDETLRSAKLKEHAAQVRAHVSRLSAKSYWNQLECTPEFVIAFLPGESFFSAALEQDPMLIETGAEQRVVLATPTTLIALLKAVAYGWRQEQLAENAQRISELGRTLYDRLEKMYDHMGKVKKGIEATVKSFNELVGSMESRVLVAARRFRELGAAGGDEIESIEPIDVAPRELPAPGPQSVKVKSIAASSASDE